MGEQRVSLSSALHLRAGPGGGGPRPHPMARAASAPETFRDFLEKPRRASAALAPTGWSRGFQGGEGMDSRRKSARTGGAEGPMQEEGGSAGACEALSREGSAEEELAQRQALVEPPAVAR